MFMKLKKIVSFKLFFSLIFFFYSLTSVYALPDQSPILKRCDAFKYEEVPIDTDFSSVNNITEDTMILSKTIEKQNFQPKTHSLGQWLHQIFHLSIDFLELTNKILELINHIS